MAYQYQPNLYGSVFPASPAPMPQLGSMNTGGGMAPTVGGAQTSSNGTGLGDMTSMVNLGNNVRNYGTQLYDYLYPQQATVQPGIESFTQMPASWSPEITQTGYSGFAPGAESAFTAGPAAEASGGELALGAGELGSMGGEAAGMGAMGAEAGGLAAGVGAAAGAAETGVTAAEILAMLGIMAA